MKTYLLTFSNEFASREKVIATIDTWSEIPFWHASLPNAVFITSSLDAAALAKKIEQSFTVQAGQRFLVLEVNQNCQGRLPQQSWHMINNPDNPLLPEKKLT